MTGWHQGPTGKVHYVTLRDKCLVSLCGHYLTLAGAELRSGTGARCKACANMLSPPDIYAIAAD